MWVVVEEEEVYIFADDADESVVHNEDPILAGECGKGGNLFDLPTVGALMFFHFDENIFAWGEEHQEDNDIDQIHDVYNWEAKEEYG